MNTQRKIFEKLSKQNFGAIEDAINEVKSKLEEYESELKDIIDSYEQEVTDAINIIINEADYMQSAIAGTENNFMLKLREFDTLMEDLSTAGVDYDQSVVINLRDQLDTIGTSARKITELDGSKF
jgi:hypothetical protein